MIGFLRGTVHSTEAGRLMLEVGGVGYELFMPDRDLMQLPPPGNEAFVYVHTAFRDDAISLYGFITRERRQLFLLLLEVSGVGPKLAMNVLAGSSAHDLLGALARGETAVLQAIHGVGKKTAARLCVDLKDRAAKLLEESGVEAASLQPAGDGGLPPGDSLAADAVSALVNLGWRAQDAERAVAAVRKELPESADIQKIITGAMSRLSSLKG